MRGTKTWAFFMGTIGSIGFLTLFGKTLLGFEWYQSILLGTGIILLLVILLFSRYFIKNYFKKNLHGEYLRTTNEIVSFLNELPKDNISDNKLITSALYICNSLRDAFTNKMKREKWAVSIKLPVGNSMTWEAKLKNLCRDDGYSRHRDTPKYKKEKHLLFKNTCFKHIFTMWTNNERDKLFYINNDIKKTEDDKNYETSSFGAYPEELRGKSELVVPIIPLLKGTAKLPIPVGFLCVDCLKKHAFDEEYDLMFLQHIADILYDILIRNPRIKNTLKK